MMNQPLRVIAANKNPHITALTCYLRRFLAALLLTGTAILLLLIGMGTIAVLPAGAALQNFEEVAGQRIYQSRQSVWDRQGNSWQVVVFKRLYPDRATHTYLRLVGFPGTVAIAHSQPLALATTVGVTLSAPDASREFFASAPESHVGQYDLQPLISQLPTNLPLTLQLPTTGSAPAELVIAPALIQEWQTVANYQQG
jgi:hypothetical protein